jgi:hypothetical protein
MGDIRLKKITVEPNQSPLIIQNGNVNFKSTNESTSMISGAVIIDGGVAINTTFDSTSSTAGGSLTVGGGVAILKNTYIGKKLRLDSTTGEFEIDGLSEKRFFVDTITNKSITFAPDGVNRTFEINDTYLKVNATTSSINSSTGSLALLGGLSINSTSVATSITNGGAITVNGGIAVRQNMIVGNGINAIGTNTIGTLITTGGNIGIGTSSPGETLDVRGNIRVGGNTQANYIAFHGTQGDLPGTWSHSFIGERIYSGTERSELVLFKGNDVNTVDGEDRIRHIAASHVFETYTSPLSGTFEEISITGGTSRLTIAQSGNVGIGDISPSARLTVNSSSSNTVLMVGNVARAIWNNSQINVVSNGTQGSSIAFERVGVDTGFMGNINGNLLMGHQGGDILFNSGAYDPTVLGTERMRVTATGNVGIGTSSPSNTLHVNGTCRFATQQYNHMTFEGDSDNFSINWRNTYNNTDTIVAQIRMDGFIGNDEQSGILSFRTANAGTLNTGMHIDKFGNVGIATGSPGYTLDVNGSARATNGLFTNVTITNMIVSNNLRAIGNSNTVGSIITTGGNVGIGLTNPSALLHMYGFEPMLRIQENTGTTSPNSGVIELLQANGTGYRTRYDGLSDRLVFESLGGGVTQGNTISFKNDLRVESTFGTSLILDSPLATNTLVEFYSSGVRRSAIYRPNNTHQLRIYMDTIAADVMTFATNGNIGIATVSPAQKLDVDGNISVGLTRQIFIGNQTTGSASLNIRDLNTKLVEFQWSTATVGSINSFVGIQGLILEGGGGSSQLVLSSAGNIGMGTTSPRAALDINVSNTYGQLFVGNAIQNRKIVLWEDAANNHQYYGFGVNVGILRYQVDNVGASHRFYAGTGATTSNELMCIQGNGNVGIGDSAPSIRLDVNGSIGMKVAVAPWDHIYLTHDGSNAMIRAGGAEGGLNFDVNTATVGSYGAVNYTRVMTLMSSGNVGIGTTSPQFTLDVNGSATLRGIVTLTNTTQSNNVSTGALLISGGVAISRNLNVLGDTVLVGNLTVQGTTTTIQTTNTVLNDNIFVLNSGPSGSRDSGFVIQRFQQDNNSGTGDVVTDTTFESNTLPSQTGMTSTQIKLSNSANSTDNYYVGWWIKVVGGFSNNQVRQITGYVGSTRVATISSAWNTQNPTINDTVYIYNKPYVGMVYNEVNDRFEFTSVASDPSTSITSTDTIPLFAKSITLNSTTQATGVGTGGTLTILGGSSISKDLYVGGTITSSSDIRLKTDIRDLKNEDEKILEKIESIRSIRYKYKDKSIDEREHLGFIAQDFENVYPELIRKSGSDGMYTLDYSKMTVILLECIKELKQEIIELKYNLSNSE